MLEVINTIILSVIQIIGCTYVIQNLSERKINFKNIKNDIIVMLLIISTTLFCIYDYNLTKPILIYISLVIGYKYVFDISFKESIIINFISMIINALSEALVVLSVVILKIPENVINKYFELTPISDILVLLLTIIIVKAFRNQLLRLQKILNKEKITYAFYILVTLGISVILSKNINNWKWNKEFFINVSTILVFIGIIMILFKEKIKAHKIDNEYKESIEQSKKVETLLEKYQKYNHENKNQLIIIKEMAENGESISEYIDSLLEEDIGHKDRWIREIYSIPDLSIRGFISIKINKMIDNGIKVITSISPKVKNMDFKRLTTSQYSDLTKMLGVYIDNAYEASKDSKEKEVTIEMYLDENQLSIIISNSFNNKDIEKVGTKGYTTKGEGHGVGLSLIDDIVSYNNNLFNIDKKIGGNYYFQYINVNTK